MNFLTIILALTSCPLLNGSPAANATHMDSKEDSDQIGMSSLTEAQREQLRAHFISLLGVPTTHSSSKTTYKISSKTDDISERTASRLSDGSRPMSTSTASVANSMPIVRERHIRSKRQAQALAANAPRSAGVGADRFDYLLLPAERSLRIASSVRINASNGKHTLNCSMEVSTRFGIGFLYWRSLTHYTVYTCA